jgi:hypothetical protein
MGEAILEAQDIRLVDAKRSQTMDRAITEIPVVVDVPKRRSMVRVAMEAPAVLDAVKRQNTDNKVVDTEAEVLNVTIMIPMVLIA